MTFSWEESVYARGKQLNQWPFSDVVSDYVTHFPSTASEKPPKVIEIGCGAGNNVYFLAKQGYEVSGFDQSLSAINFAKARMTKERLQADVWVSSVSDWTPLPEDFDSVLDRGCITQLSVSEARRTVSKVWKALRPGGWFFSYTLYGAEHPEKLFGRSVDDTHYDHFTGGYFRNVGPTSFFSIEQLRQLFSDFGSVRFQKILSEDPEVGVTGVEWNVRARK
jgi:cyclopropane fatty-acyl-phospholipid synthase-like methyltransferase